MTALRVIQAGLSYFIVVFAAGFALGTIRVPFLVPRLGERWAELIEMPFMLGAIFLAARWAVRRFALPPAASARLGAGVLALAGLVAAELMVVLRLRGLSLGQYIETRDPVSGSVYLLMLLLFALMPLLIVAPAGQRSD